MNENNRIRILLADDDDDDTFLFQEALDQIEQPTELTITANGMELTDMLALESMQPDLIFLDMNMPVKNGLECLEEIRRIPRFANVPVVILSTSVAQYLWESAYHGGANLYIQKPTSFAELVKVIQKCLDESAERPAATDLERFLIRN